MSVEPKKDLAHGRVFSWALAVLLVMVAILGALENLSISALPVLQRELQMSVPEAALCTAIFGLSAGVALPVIGKLGDLFGGRKVMLIAMSTAVVGAMICAIATSALVVILGFVLLGVGGSAIVTAVIVIGQLSSAHRSSSATGLFVGAVVLGGSAGAILAGPIADSFSRFWMYMAPAGLLAVLVIVSALVLPRHKEVTVKHVAFDWLGMVAFCVSLIALQLAMLWSSTSGWSSPLVLSGLATALIIGIGFVLIERKSAQPFVDMAMLMRPSMRGSVLVALIVGFSYGVGFFLLQQILFLPAGPDSPGFGYSLTQISLILAPGIVLGILFAPMAGVLIRKIGLRGTVVVSLVCLVIGSGMLIWWHDQAWHIVAGAVLIVGVAGSMLYTAAITGAEYSVSAAETGIATSVVMTARTIGAIVGAPVAASLLTIGGTPGNVAPTNTGFQLAFSLAAVLALLGFSFARILPSRRPEDLPQPWAIENDEHLMQTTTPKGQTTP